MSSRQKRLKSALPIRARPVGRLSAGTAETSRRNSCRDGNTVLNYDPEHVIVEGGCSASRSSVRLINEVVSKFDQEKRELVSLAGFATILHFPVVKQLNRKFSMWLMSCVNEHESSISIGDHIKIKFNKTDVAQVFGIPASGKHIIDVRHSSREAKEKVLNELLPTDFKEFRSIKVVQEVIERQYVYPMSKLESERFKVAFVVFVVSILLAPSAKYDYACIDYWNAIQNPDDIGGFDWSDYVLFRLFEGVSKLKQDLSSNIKFPNITGCSLFLQVLYLDSISIEGLSMPHTNFPRIVDFSHDKLRYMIQADSNYARYGKGHQVTDTVKLRDPSKCIYSWAVYNISEDDVDREQCLFGIWEAAVAMVHLLKIPLESAGPIFIAAADFEEQISSGMLVSGIHAIKFMSVLVSIMIPYSRGFSYLASVPVNSTDLGFDVVESAILSGMRNLSVPMRIRRREAKSITHVNQSLKCKHRDHLVRGSCSAVEAPANGSSTMLEHEDTGQRECRYVCPVIASLDDIPHKLNMNLRVATAMSQFYSVIKKMKSAKDFDLNSVTVDWSLCGQPYSALVSGEGDGIVSPWDLGIVWSYDSDESSRVFCRLKSVEDDQRPAIVHGNPKYIHVSVGGLVAQVTGRSESGLDFVDAIIRSIVQDDDERYMSYGSDRWRYFFESDFMEGILSGSFDLVDSNLRIFLRLTKLNYNMLRSKLVFFPALLQCSWVCFAWNLESNELFVFEPRYRAPIPDFRLQAIERAAYLLRIGLQTLSRTSFIGISVDATVSVLRIVSLPFCVQNRFNRSGVLCMYFCRCFDGHDMNPNHAVVEVDAIATRLLKDVVKLKDNLGVLPSMSFLDT